MDMDIQPKKIDALFPTDIVFQTAYWGKVKSRFGWKPVAFDYQSSTGQQGDVMVLIRLLGRGLTAACIPQGPEFGPAPEKYGLFLEALSQEMVKHLDPTVAFIRYDLPWEAPDSDNATDGQSWSGHPAPQLRELRMNMGTHTWNLRKASLDLTVADTLIIDLARTESDILAAMKPKTRYNIRLAERKEVRVFDASVEMLPLFYRLYLQTAKRNGFFPGSYRHFSALFSTRALKSGEAEIIFLLAAQGRDILAGTIIAISGRRAVYLFGASANDGRNLMGPYAIHWEGIKKAREKGCRTYDMGAVSPVGDPSHPFYGMYRFKTGFGGKVVHRNGSWDYPINRRGYRAFRNFESLAGGRLPE
jgi:lipid II:glycine glycyltransferase (peptidoglycan interpeptide bridge formation enzyme)